MQAIILAAGLGERLGSLTSENPKALLRVSGRELILRALDFLDHAAISERIVVTGCKAKLVEDFLRERRGDVRTVHNPYFTDGSIRSLEAALPLMRGDFLVMNVDHIYPKRLMQRLLEYRKGIAAVCDFDRPLGADDMKVKLDKAGKLKMIRKTLGEFDCGYIGMALCDAASLPAYRAGVAVTKKADGMAASADFALGHMAKSGPAVSICNASGIKWLEVDTPEDLKFAERTLNDNPGFLS